MAPSSSKSSTTLCLSLLILLSLTSISRADDKLTAYDALKTFNFPEGLLPKGALGYDLEEKSGNFKAFLNGSCSFKLEGSYELKYSSTISGLISKNKLANLTGVKVKVMFLWLNIVEIRRDGDDLEFSVGIMSAGFPVDNFEESPQCGCGLNCDHNNNNKIEIGDFVSSI